MSNNNKPYIHIPKPAARIEAAMLTEDYYKRKGLTYWLKTIPIEQIHEDLIPEHFVVLGRKREMSKERQRIIQALIYRANTMTDEPKPEPPITPTQAEALKRVGSTIDQRVEALKAKAAERKQRQQKKMNGKLPLPGVRFHLPADQSVIKAVEEGMEAFPKDQESAAKAIGLHKGSYSFIRKLIILRDDQWVPREIKAAIEKCLATIEKERRIADVTGIANPIIKRYWIVRKDPPERIIKRKRRFDQNMVAIRESCECTTDMMIPRELTRDDVADAISSLTLSAELINKLIRRLVGGDREESSNG